MSVRVCETSGKDVSSEGCGRRPRSFLGICSSGVCVCVFGGAIGHAGGHAGRSIHLASERLPERTSPGP